MDGCGRVQHMVNRLRSRQELQLAGEMWRAAPAASAWWWSLLVLRAVTPPLLAIAIGTLVSAVDDDRSLAGPLVFVGAVFVVLQVLTPIHQAVSATVGTR